MKAQKYQGSKNRTDIDWSVVLLSEVAEILDNLRKPLNEKERRQIPGPIPYCGANGVVDYISDYLIDDDIILIAEDGGYFDEYRTRPIAYRMSGKCWVNNHAHILKAKRHIDQGFLFYSLVHKDILDFVNGGTRAKLNKGNMVHIPICLPSRIEEQKAIAEVLSDVDELIAQTERLIAKKEAIKMGVMQELLRPKEGWEWTTLGNLVGTITTGKLNANAMKENGEFRFYTCSKEFYWIDSFAFDGEAILVSGNGANVGYVHHYSGKFNAYQRTYVLMDFKIYPVFLKHYLLRFFSERVKTEVSAGNTPYIKMGTIADMIIWFPSELTIQSAIAEAISDVDEELGALRELNFKYERLKMGIMNQLLTGKTRLV